MTRTELIAAIEAWGSGNEDLAQRDKLQFAIWWYGASTEADKGCWPGEDYIRSKLGGGPYYLSSVDAALTVIHPGTWIDISTGTQKRARSLEWPVVKLGCQAHGTEYGTVQAKTLPVALCLAGLKMRAARNVNQQPRRHRE